MNLLEKIEKKEVKIVVMGLGYVGLPLAISFAEKGIKVTGFDLSEKKVHLINNGESDIIDVPSKRLANSVMGGYFSATTSKKCLNGADVIIICVPTPLTQSYEPDISFINTAMEDIQEYFSSETLVILESTTYPGTSRELIQKPLSEAGYILDEDYFVCYSPERVDPGNKHYKTENTPKVVGGISKKSTEAGQALYNHIIKEVVPVATTEVAEMSKLLENTFRSINIAFINEMALLCEKMNIDIWETIDAASTKPFGFMRFNPGPGIGGHCIPLDPMYLSWKAKESNFFSRFIELAQEINHLMPEHIIYRAMTVLNLVQKPLSGSKILLIGMAYKENIDDLRESPSIEIFEKLQKTGAEVSFCDPLAKTFYDKSGKIYNSIELDYSLMNDYDLTILLTCHDLFDKERIVGNSSLILDTKNYLENCSPNKIVCFGKNNSEILSGVQSNRIY
ncbi:nucleotide sugar dehydrogenase [Bacillus cereus BAG1X2-3]|uniref:Nucleotide sugar dehydrogenase n=1 Tax=Bacillus cereus TaxID=1396 RepID=A0A9X7E100_BACCE|nr:nucleotide sugar dehydrogenase [Bacillus cereus]EOO23291.1 nucleotide sugar dehydrogenase [Bacillus cereus BAG1X1-1]EOO42860.1 nucleotide sugar dehydrogenase [Bacillus cereus BAG1X2-1]EOO56413.1 nucleotide sugar dehydrogenase [Bacillus cereus BAG1X2-3]EOP00116.1 nucleotide sugar dehydrogenase [Bacillus cereus BAG2O-1]PHA19189.1 nucleotide sugar dehydrogenase [Bacillus cereus]